MSRHELITLGSVLVVIGAILALTTVPGVFTIDEDNYLVSALSLRSGGFEVPGTKDLTRSKELAYFAPQPDRYVVRDRPVATDAPPLYGFFALPFLTAGWGGLFALNILSFLVAAACVYLLVRFTTSQVLAAWLAMALFVLGGYSLEYAQAVWPHMLAVALCVSAFVAASRLRQGSSLWWAFGAGLLAASAAGVREQDIVVAGGIGLGLVVLGPRRFRTAVVYGVGLALPLLVSATVNYERMGIFHPVPKSSSYVASVQGSPASPASKGRSAVEPLAVLWTKVVDFSTHPLPKDTLEARFFHREAASGAIMTGTVVKKSLLQSAPWIGAALMALLAAWMAGLKNQDRAGREMLALSLIIGPILAMIAYAGYAKTDGISHNQRYLLEVVPFAAIALGLVIAKAKMRPIETFLGFVGGVVLAFVVMLVIEPPTRYSMIITVPLIVAAAMMITVLVLRWGKAMTLFGVLVGLSIGWAFFVHLNDDVRGVNAQRKANLHRSEILGAVIPDSSAIVAYGGSKDPAGPLQVSRDVVILDAWADRGADAPLLVEELLGQGRRVFVLANLMPEELLQRMARGRRLVPVHANGMQIYEIRPEQTPDVPPDTHRDEPKG